MEAIGLLAGRSPRGRDAAFTERLRHHDERIQTGGTEPGRFSSSRRAAVPWPETAAVSTAASLNCRLLGSHRAWPPRPERLHGGSSAG